MAFLKLFRMARDGLSHRGFGGSEARSLLVYYVLCGFLGVMVVQTLGAGVVGRWDHWVFVDFILYDFRSVMKSIFQFRQGGCGGFLDNKYRKSRIQVLSRSWCGGRVRSVYVPK